MKEAEEFPKFFVVSGAGFAAVNGTYYFVGIDEDDGPLFEMEGKLDGEPTTFLIDASEQEPERIYRISLKGSSHSGENLFYSNNCVANSALPPARGWWPEDFINMPVAPILGRNNEPVRDWRSDPLDSFADYKIEIFYEKDGAVTTTEYHTHRMILADGSSYFANLLRSKHSDGVQYTESQSNSCRIRVEAPQAKMFPFFLDCLYGQYSNSAPLGTIRPAAYQQDVLLYQVAHYFAAWQIVRDLEVTFLKASEQNLAYFVEEVDRLIEWRLDMTAVLDILVVPCAKKLTELEDLTLRQLARVLTKDQLYDLLQEATDAASCKGSELVTAFFSKRQVDLETFRLLTDAALLPHIDKKSVWPLLERDRELFGPTQGAFSSLEVRCIDALAQDFDPWDYGDDSPLRMQSPAFMFELLKKEHEQKANLYLLNLAIANEDEPAVEANDDENEQNVEPAADANEDENEQNVEPMAN